VLGAGMVAAPFVTGEALEPMGDARFALAFAGSVVALSSFICVFFFRSRNRVRRQLLAGRDLLVRWIYTEAEWRAFAGEETRRQAAFKRTLLWITAIIMVVITGLIAASNPEVGLGVGGVMLVTWVVCWLAARGSMRSYRRREKGTTPEARIARDGLLLGEEFHLWRGWGQRFERCAMHEGPPPQIEITYSTPGRYNRSEISVRVPVPAGKEAEAAALLQRLEQAKA